MKQFLITFVAALLGVALALALYDAMVVQPRATSAANAQVHQVDLAQARSEAARITADVDESIDRSVAKVRAANEAQAQELEKRRLAMEPLARASMFRTALTEFYLTEGRWPASAADVGLPATDTTRGSAGRISVGAGGTITIAYD
ncbi:MAG: pilin, partial [Lysobacter sp.]